MSDEDIKPTGPDAAPPDQSRPGQAEPDAPEQVPSAPGGSPAAPETPESPDSPAAPETPNPPETPGAPAPEDPDDEPEPDAHPPGSMGFFEHLGELRQRLVRCFVAVLLGFLACYSFAEDLFALLMAPLVTVFPTGSHLIYTHVTEAFFTYMLVAAVAGIFLVSPYLFYQVWCFVAPGLYDEERKALLPIAFFSAFFFTAGAMFGYHVVFPPALDFLMGYSTELIKPMPKLDEYLSFALRMLFAFGLIFEMPLFVYFLARLGMVTAGWMRRSRKYAILCNFIIAAALTPGPDVVSQLLMAGPLIVLYELSIFVAAVFGRRQEPPAESPEAREDLDAAEQGEQEAMK